MKKDGRIAEALRGFVIAGCVAMALAESGNCAPADPKPVAAQNPYADMNCAQIQAEYGRLNRDLTIDRPSMEMSGAAAAASAVTKGLPVPGVSAEATARRFDRAISSSDILHRMGYLIEAHRDKSCAGRLDSGTAATCALVDEKAAGEREYRNNCAKCHGETGRGNGWLAAYLKTRPPSIDRVKRNNGGTFPAERVAEIIDGRKEVKAHGPREMPVWGGIYRTTGDKRFELYGGLPCPADEIVRTRIHALVGHISQLQE
jgi:mono/diheme cytochrome c family protein